MPTHKKKIDRDKYYNLAKEQGYRSRAAFKLIQINKKHDILSKARVCIDLCAAPGGWCQVAAKTMPANSVVLGVDLLPIRPIRNVKTLVSDITTAECRALIKREIPNGWKADVVLCDGAPNVGAAYVKDAFVQNELALAALKTGTDHLGKGGAFCTKVYRSQDYNALLWVFKQLFDEVQAIKPSSSRSQSAEIFVLCTGYKAPASLDPRLLDPAHVFKQIDIDEPDKKPSIFDKAYDKQKRQRTGYSDKLGQSLRRSDGVCNFISCVDPGQFLADTDEIVFDHDEVLEKGGNGLEKLFLNHSATTIEVKECCKDVRVLNKGDFKTLLKWRLKLREFKAELLKSQSELINHAGIEAEEENDEGGDKDGFLNIPKVGKKGGEDEMFNKPENDEDIMTEIQQQREAARLKAKREKKKQRELAAKLRERKAYGMDHNSFEVVADEQVFSLNSIKSEKHLDQVSKVKLNKMTDDSVHIDDDSKKKLGIYDEIEVGSDVDDEEREKLMNERVEDMLESSYTRYLGRRGYEDVKGTKSHKRSKKAAARKAAELASEDAEEWEGDADAYAKLLTGGDEDDEDSDSSSEDDGFHDKPDSDSEEDEEEEEGRSTKRSKVSDANNGMKKKHPLLVKETVHNKKEVPSAAMSRWFSDPVFEGMGEEDDEEEEEEDEEEEEEEEKEEVKQDSGRNRRKEGEGLVVMPLSDKELRHQKRVKNVERTTRQKTRKESRLELQPGLEIVPLDGEVNLKQSMKRKQGSKRSLDNDDMDSDAEEELTILPTDDAKTIKDKQMKQAIRAGVGRVDASLEGDIEFVKAGGKKLMPPRVDDRLYDSDHEDYDSEDNAVTLALGTLMLRKSRAKKLVDASYNRFAWNDPADLPEWFVDDEAKNYRPQLPIPKPLLEKMKQRFEDLTTKPIKKVAEARARKRKRGADKLKAAKKKAEALSNVSDMSEKEKLKAITKAMKSGVAADERRPEKKVVVAKKSFGGKKPKGAGKVKMVDKRMKNDNRSMKRAEKKKSGKKTNRKHCNN